MEPLILTEDQVQRCDICGAPVYVGQGCDNGAGTSFGVWTVRSKGKYYVTTRSRRHFPRHCNYELWLSPTGSCEEAVPAHPGAASL